MERPFWEMRVEPELLVKEIHIKGTRREKFPTVLHEDLQRTHKSTHDCLESAGKADHDSYSQLLLFLPLTSWPFLCCRSQRQPRKLGKEIRMPDDEIKRPTIACSQPEAAWVRRKGAFTKHIGKFDYCPWLYWAYFKGD